MFDDIGEKIKMVAKIACWIGIILSVCCGLYDFAHEMPIDGIIWIVVGPISSWIGTFVLYGFGELIDRVTSIEYKVNILGETPEQNEGALSKLMRSNSVSQTEENNGWKCQCGRFNPMYVGTCSCGKEKNGNLAFKSAPKRTVRCPECGSVEDASHAQCYKCGAKLQ